jgi:hypothetical protein
MNDEGARSPPGAFLLHRRYRILEDQTSAPESIVSLAFDARGSLLGCFFKRGWSEVVVKFIARNVHQFHLARYGRCRRCDQCLRYGWWRIARAIPLHKVIDLDHNDAANPAMGNRKTVSTHERVNRVGRNPHDPSDVHHPEKC